MFPKDMINRHGIEYVPEIKTILNAIEVAAWNMASCKFIQLRHNLNTNRNSINPVQEDIRTVQKYQREAGIPYRASRCLNMCYLECNVFGYV